MADERGGGGARLSGPEVEERLTRLEGLLSQLEQVPGPGTELAMDAVATLTAVYGEALARVMTRLGDQSQAAADLAGDELLGHLLILHGLTPVPTGERVAAALAGVRPFVQSQGGEVRLAGVDGETARVQLSGHCQGCSSPATAVRDAITEAILGAAPELTAVEVESVTAAEPALIPVEALLRPREASA